MALSGVTHFFCPRMQSIQGHFQSCPISCPLVSAIPLGAQMYFVEATTSAQSRLTLSFTEHIREPAAVARLHLPSVRLSPEAGLPTALLDSAPKFKDILPNLTFWWHRPGIFRPYTKG